MTFIRCTLIFPPLFQLTYYYVRLYDLLFFARVLNGVQYIAVLVTYIYVDISTLLFFLLFFYEWMQ